MPLSRPLRSGHTRSGARLEFELERGCLGDNGPSICRSNTEVNGSAYICRSASSAAAWATSASCARGVASLHTPKNCNRHRAASVTARCSTLRWQRLHISACPTLFLVSGLLRPPNTPSGAAGAPLRLGLTSTRVAPPHGPGVCCVCVLMLFCPSQPAPFLGVSSRLRLRRGG